MKKIVIVLGFAVLGGQLFAQTTKRATHTKVKAKTATAVVTTPAADAKTAVTATPVADAKPTFSTAAESAAKAAPVDATLATPTISTQSKAKTNQ